ncbi:MAG TPA: energy transducer TonB, partial [Pyrinomonadaceae bacterium]|nr:energy transducer TonB [Pyrinomonadaceae bacterium]
MKIVFRGVLALLFLIISILSIPAQVKNGVVGAKLLHSEAVQIPKEAADARLGGPVYVLVAIDKDGNVSGVKNIVGPGFACSSVGRPGVAAMQTASRETALKAKFSPATKNGKPRETTLWMTFNFPIRPFNPEPMEVSDSGDVRTIKGGVVNG